MSELRVANAFKVEGLDLTLKDGLFDPAMKPNDDNEPALEVEVGGNTNGSFSVFDQNLKVSGSAGAKLLLTLHQAGREVENPFGEATDPGHLARWGEFTINGALEAGFSGGANVRGTAVIDGGLTRLLDGDLIRLFDGIPVRLFDGRLFDGPIGLFEGGSIRLLDGRGRGLRRGVLVRSGNVFAAGKRCSRDRAVVRSARR